MNYTPITEENIEKVATLYMNHYNQHSGGCWTYEKAYKRIHQMVMMEDSLCLMQEDDNDIPTGLVIGFLESYDDFTFYYLDEILIFGEYQNKGYGRQLLQEVEQRHEDAGGPQGEGLRQLRRRRGARGGCRRLVSERLRGNRRPDASSGRRFPVCTASSAREAVHTGITRS